MVIPITEETFLIGRDAKCNLRPATSVVSKKHCGIVVRDGKVSIVDYGSTNGTLVNNTVLRNRAIEIHDGAVVMVATHGPLEFTVAIEQELNLKIGDSTPGVDSEVFAEDSQVPAMPPIHEIPFATPVDASIGTKESPPLANPVNPYGATARVLQPLPRSVQPAPSSPPPYSSEDDSESIAALLLRSDPGQQDLPEGGTFRIISSSPSEEENENIAAAILLDGSNMPKEKAPKKAPVSAEEMSNAANDLLRKMRQGSAPKMSCRFLS